jgi:phage-related protein
MGGQFRIAEGYVEVTADETGYDRAMQRLRSKKNTVTVGLELDDSAALVKLRRFADEHSRTVLKAVLDAELTETSIRRVTAQLDRLTKDRVVNIRANVDTRVGAAEIANLTQRRQVRIGIDVDTRVAADSLANLTRRRTMTVQARADTADAAARLALLTRDRTVNIGVGAGGAASVALLSSRITGLVAAAVSAMPMLASLVQSIAAMGPAAAVAAPAVLSLGTAFAAVKLGTSGIGAAFKQAFAPATSSGNAAAAATRRVEDAQRSLAKAQQGVKDAEQRAAEARVQAARQVEDAQRSLKSTVRDVADANRRAAEQVAQAERDLADAQRAARQAQRDLTQARKDAAMELEDLNNRLADAQLDQRQKVLDLQDAEQNLTAVKAKGAAASAEDLAKAQLQYDQALQALNEQQTETARLQEKADAANKAGVEGSKTVADAKQKIKDANQDVADKTREVKDAETEAARTQVDGAEKVAKAERDVADARAAAAKAAKDGARQIKDAQQAVADAARNVAEAQTAGAQATSKTADALAKLAPSAREFVKAVVAQAGAWKALKLDVQQRLFDGLGDTFTTMSRAILPSVHDGLVGTAGILNQTAKNAGNAITELGKTGTLRKMFDGLNEGMKPLAKVPGQFITGLAQISVAASPAFKRLTTAAAGASDRISKKISDAFKSGALEKAIDHAIGIAKQFGRVIADAFGTLRNIMDAASLGGVNALSSVGDAFKELRRVTGLPEMQEALGSIFESLHTIAGDLIDVVGAALQNLIPIAAPFVSMIAGLADKVTGPLMSFFGFLGDHQTLVGSLAAGILAVVTAVKAWEVATLALAAAQAIWDALWTASPVGLIVGALVGLAGAFAYAWTHSETFRDTVQSVWEAVKGFFSGTWDIIDKYIVQPFKRLYDILVGHSIIPDLVHAIIGWFKNLWDWTKQLFTNLKNWVVDTWKSLWNSVRSKWDGFWSGLRSAVSGAWKNLKDSVSSLKTAISNTWSSLWNGAKDKMSSIFSAISSKITGFKNGMKSAFSSLRDSLGSIWNGIKSKIGSPIKWVIDHVYNNGIRKMWNTIAGKISSHLTLPTISLGFNKGGVVPGTGSTDTVPAMLTPGERILSKQQVAQLGGHKGIDAMLGQDHPTKTGGNPSNQQERKREQAGQQHFASGGIIGKIGSVVGGAVDWAKDLVIGGLQAAARKAITSLVKPLINSIPGGGVGSLLKGLSNKALDGILGFLGKEDKKAVGGPAVQRALAWVKTQDGKKYQWAGNGNPSWDCSGLMSAIESVIRGEHPHRRWATGAFSGSNGPSGWVRNLNSPFMIGITNAGVGHTAGTLAGMNVESSGGRGVHMGKSARGYNDPMFTSRWGFKPATKYDTGGLLQPGATLAVNNTGRPEAVLTADERAQFQALIGGLHAGMSIQNLTVSIAGTFDLSSPSERKKAANAMVVEIKEALRNYDRGRAR